MDFYINSFLAKIPCTRLYRQIQDPRGRSIIAYSTSNDGSLIAVVTVPKNPGAIEKTFNSVLIDPQNNKAWNCKGLKQQRTPILADGNELELKVHENDHLHKIASVIAFKTSSIRHLIEDDEFVETCVKLPCIVQCTIILFDSFNFNPVQEFVYSHYSFEGGPCTRGYCDFLLDSIKFSLDDLYLILISKRDGLKIYRLDGEYVEFICHYRPKVELLDFKLMNSEICLSDVRPKSRGHECVECRNRLAAVDSLDDCLPYLWRLNGLILLNETELNLVQLKIYWPTGEIEVEFIKRLHDECFYVEIFNKIIYDVDDDVINELHYNRFNEPYHYESTCYLLPGSGETLGGVESKFVERVGSVSLISLYSQDELILMDFQGEVRSRMELVEPKDGFTAMKVSGNFILMIGIEETYIIRIISREDDGERFLSLELCLQLPLVAGVGRREEYVDACIGDDMAKKWLYVSLIRGTSDSLFYIIDITSKKIKRTLNMNSTIFPTAVKVQPLKDTILLLPAHRRYIIQLTREHVDNLDEYYVKQFSHFPILSTNKEVVQLEEDVMYNDFKLNFSGDLILGHKERKPFLGSKFNPLNWLNRHYTNVASHAEPRLPHRKRVPEHSNGTTNNSDTNSGQLSEGTKESSLQNGKRESLNIFTSFNSSVALPLRRRRPQIPYEYDYEHFKISSESLTTSASKVHIKSQIKKQIHDHLRAVSDGKSGLNTKMFMYMDYLLARVCLFRMGNSCKVLQLSTNEYLILQHCDPTRRTVNVEGEAKSIEENTNQNNKIIKQQIKRDDDRSDDLMFLAEMEPMKIRKILRDRIYRLRKKLFRIKEYKEEIGIDKILEQEIKSKCVVIRQPTTDDCRLPDFNNSCNLQTLLQIEANIFSKIKFYEELIYKTKHGINF